ncbi:MAG TPA: diguanylate cyclase [Kineosporiaceae bacterium]|nr:diguanylate cyclase [Kineosporiaceae bacterium]
MPEDEEGVARAAVEALDETFAVYRVERDAAGAVCGLFAELMNAPAARWMAATPGELIGRELAEFSPQARENGIWDLLAGACGRRGTLRERITVGSGPASMTLEVTAACFGTDRVVLTCRDVTERMRERRLLEEAYEQAASARATLQTALDSTSDAFAIYDVVRNEQERVGELRLVLINMAGAAPLGREPEELVGEELYDLFPAVRDGDLMPAVEQALNDQVTRCVRLHEHDGEGRWLASWDNTVAPVGHERVVITWRDVTADERRQRDLARAHDQAWHAATHDTLTGLANRALLQERLVEALWEADEEDPVAVVYVDLDKFKQVNDTLGHAAGDGLLKVVASRLSGVIRGQDLAARVGGDEFVLLLRHVRPEWDPAHFVERVRSVIEQPVMLAEAAVTPRASYGVVSCPPAPRDLDLLLQRADALMYQDKLAHA